MNTPARVDAALLDAYERYLATRPAHTRDAYLRDIAALKALAGEAPLADLSSADVRRFLATLHGRGLSGRSLARVLSGWRTFFRFATDRDHTFKDPMKRCSWWRSRATTRLPCAIGHCSSSRIPRACVSPSFRG
jgi:site-specific recombinase XerC